MARLYPQQPPERPLAETPISSDESKAAVMCHDIRSVVARQISREWTGDWRGGGCHRTYDSLSHLGRRITPIFVWEN